MARQPTWKLHWPALIVLVLLAMLPAAAWELDETTQLGRAVELLAVVVPSVIAAVQYLYERVDTFRLTVNRLRLRLLNPETEVSISLEYDLVCATKAFSQVVNILRESGDGKRLSTEEASEVWLWRGNTVVVHADQRYDVLSDQQGILRVELPATRRSFRGMDKALRDEVGPLLSGIEREVAADSRKYVVNVEFPRGIPILDCWFQT